MKVGGKEVELIDLLSGPVINNEVVPTTTSSKRAASEPADDLPSTSWKKPKKKTTHSLVKFTTEGCDALVLPSPSNDHQWTFNPRKLPVTQVAVDSFLSRVLRPHQKEGVTFLYECVMGMKNSQYFGSILADEMGLGKTLQTITLLWTLLRKGPYGGYPVVRRALVVSPSSLVLNWQKEFDRWLGKHRLRTFAVDQKNKVTEFARLTQIPIMLISYEMLMRNFDDISQIKFDILVCDEGHRLKNNNIRTSVLLNQLEIKARVLLTGTPIQNDLQEFYALVDFVNPGILGSAQEFRKKFEEPIVASRQPNCTNDEQVLGDERALELNSRTSCFILRRTQAVINQYLPTKTEIVVFIKPVPIQRNLCRAALDWWENRDRNPGSGDVCHLGVMTALKKICNHPALIKCENLFEDDPDDDTGSYQESLLQELSNFYNGYEGGNVAVHHSAKLTVVRRLMEHTLGLGERMVLVSYFTQTLDLLASLCDEMGLRYCRLDGSTPSTQRTAIVDEFNATYSQSVIFLLSARAGGVGLNLVGASRLVLFDSDWNPASDAQAMSRIWRDGQRKSVYIYRLLTCGTIEEKIFQRQLSKAGLSGAVVDPQKRSKIKLSKEELKDLFTFHSGEESITHCSLNCNCDGSGSVPSPGDSSFSDDKENELDDDERDCQLRLGSKSKHDQNEQGDLRMNQLFQWQHHGPPFVNNAVQLLGLLQASDLLAFMFVSPPSTEPHA
ncbi:DNA repair and recombination protein RAD54B-like isoform X2 [Thrips palmi]|nr:DNA repair and recombination protein RAD54B-like isoform X2 [Thrips palmi]